MCVSEFEAIQLMKHMAERLQRIGIVHVVKHSTRREADAHAIRAPHLRYGVGYFQREPRAIPRRSAILIRAPVRAVAEKLIKQIPVGIVNFHAVEAGGFRMVRRDGILHHNARQLLFGQRRDAGLGR